MSIHVNTSKLDGILTLKVETTEVIHEVQSSARNFLYKDRHKLGSNPVNSNNRAVNSVW